MNTRKVEMNIRQNELTEEEAYAFDWWLECGEWRFDNTIFIGSTIDKNTGEIVREAMRESKKPQNPNGTADLGYDAIAQFQESGLADDFWDRNY
jgi:hypothetical protein